MAIQYQAVKFSLRTQTWSLEALVGPASTIVMVVRAAAGLEVLPASLISELL